MSTYEREQKKLRLKADIICNLCGYRWGDHYGKNNARICPTDYTKVWEHASPPACLKEPPAKPVLPDQYTLFGHPFLACFSTGDDNNWDAICRICGERHGDHYSNFTGEGVTYVCPKDKKAYDQWKDTGKNPFEHNFKRCFPNYPENQVCTRCGMAWLRHDGGTSYAVCPAEKDKWDKIKYPSAPKLVPWRKYPVEKLFGKLYPSFQRICSKCRKEYGQHYGDDWLAKVMYCPGEEHPGYPLTISELARKKAKKDREQEKRAAAQELAKKKAYCTPWGIEPELNLCQHAADFYLLIDANVEHPENITVKLALQQETDFLAEQFSAYLDMILGGEIRHFTSYCYAWEYHRSLTLQEASPAAKKLMNYLDKLDEKPEREAAWLEWKGLRTEHGLDFLRANIELFELEWKDKSYGGHTWAIVGRTLLDYLTGATSARVFVDTAWGLQHNSDIIFDKLWNTNDLKDVLDANLDGKLEDLKEWASTKVKSLLDKLPK